MVKRDLGSTFFDIQTDETLDDIVHKIGEERVRMGPKGMAMTYFGGVIYFKGGR